MNPRIPMLEALLSRIKSNACHPRVAMTAAPVAVPAPAAERHDKEPGTQPSARNDLELELAQTQEREVEAPLESRARLVAAQPAEEEDVEELGADDVVVELDDRHIVPEQPMTMNPPSEQ